MTAQCDICGARFATRKCYFCEGKISMLSVLRRNKTIIGILVGFWIFTVYPIPFLQMTGYKIDASAFQPILITTGVMTIPFVFMFIAWRKRAPRDSRRSDRYNY